MKRYILFEALFIVLMCSSCSLKYAQEQNVDEIIPEFSFSDSVLTRYENNKKNLELRIGQMEQYRDGHSMFAKDVLFSTFDKDGLVMEGSCVYLSADTKKEIYELYEQIKIYNKKEGINVSGRSFHWNGKNEQLVAGRNDTVSVEKDGMVVRGSGFSASGASTSFVFNSVITGSIDTKNE